MKYHLKKLSAEPIWGYAQATVAGQMPVHVHSMLVWVMWVHAESIFAQQRQVAAEQILVVRMVVLAEQKDAWLMWEHVAQKLALEK